MVTFIVLIAVIVGGGFLSWYERYQKQLLIAKVIDGQKVDDKYISKECQLVIAQLNDRENLKLKSYTSCIVLPDGQEISYRFDDPITMQNNSKLRFEPSKLEWEILKGIIKRIIR